jgi:hypothetical protein
VFDEQIARRIRIPIVEIADVVFSGDDSAAKAQKIWERRHGKLEPGDTSAWGDWQDRPTLILVALARELRGIARVLRAKVRGSTVIGRLGEQRAIGSTIGIGGGAAQAIAAEQPRLVISCGFSGALDRRLDPGDVVLASSVCDENGESIPVAARELAVARAALGGVAEGEILCATRVAATRGEKRGLARPGRLAIDLESWAIARAAQRGGIPWLAIRVIVDPIDSDLPAFARDARTSYLAPALRYALGSPSAAIEVARLGVRARIASRSLEHALIRLAGAVAHLEGS